MPGIERTARASGPTLGILLGGMVTAAVCAGPWCRVRSHQLFGTTGEVAAYLTPPGLMTMLMSALVVVLVAAERGSGPLRQETRRTFALGAMWVALGATVVLLHQALSGPPDYRAAPQVHTSWFHAAVVSSVVTSALAVARFRHESRPRPALTSA